MTSPEMPQMITCSSGASTADCTIKTIVSVPARKGKKDHSRSYKTKQKAGKTDSVPAFLPVITNQKYQQALTFCQNGNACLHLVSDSKKLTYKNGLIYLDGLPATEAGIRKYYTDDGIDSINLPLLGVLYGIILQKHLSGSPSPPGQKGKANIYYPDLAKSLGKPKPNKNDIEALNRDMELLKKIVGVIKKGDTSTDILPLLESYRYDPGTNTFCFSSPYMGKLISEIHNDSIRKDKNGKAVLKKNGEPQMQPAYSFLVDIRIAKERNRRAVEIVLVVVTLVEQAGKHIPNIRAETIIGRTDLLSRSLQGQATNHKNVILRRSFKKAWELLRTKTSLSTIYKDIKLPDPADAASIPTCSTLGQVFRFPHAGKDQAS